MGSAAVFERVEPIIMLKRSINPSAISYGKEERGEA